LCHSRPYNPTQGQISPQKWFYSCGVDVEVAAPVFLAGFLGVL